MSIEKCNVITYQLAYTHGEATICAACVARGDHKLGALGPVSHGQRRGWCDGVNHRMAHAQESK